MLRLRFVAQTALAALVLCAPLQHASAKDVEYEDIQNLVTQKEQIENRIGDLQIRINAASAQSTYCTAEERQADLRHLRALQREAKALAAEYAKFKKGFTDLAATPTAGPALIAAGVHPDDRQYWIVDDNDVQKLVPSALKKADQVENARIVDCEAKKSTPVTPQVTTNPSPAKNERTSVAPKTAAPTPERPTTPLGPTAPLGGPLPRPGCTDKERHDAILRLQEEILRLEQELIPIDGTTKEGRARQLQLTAELDRLKKLMDLACPPLLPPLKASPPPQKVSKVPIFKVTPSIPSPPKPEAPAPKQIIGPIYIDPFLKLEDEADDALDDLEDAMDDCDEEAVKALIPQLEALSRAAHAAANAARAAGGFSRVNAAEAEAMARDLDEAIEDARKFKCLLKPLKGYHYLRLNSLEQRILYIHNEERDAVHVQPLKWDFKLEWDAIGYADHLAQTHQLIHAPREGRGVERENLLQALPGWSPDRMMQSWTVEKRDFRPGYFPDVAIDGNWLNVAHYTQMIWPTTTEIGCGYATGGGFGWLVCRYSPGGNKDGKPVGLPYVPERG